MSALVFCAALASAFLNACWNAAAKRRAVPSDALLGIIITTAFCCAVACPLVGTPKSAVWPWILGGAVFNVMFIKLLMKAYDRTNFGTAYPVARGVIPPTAYVLGFSIFGEPITALGLVGVGLVLCGLILFTFRPQQLTQKDVTGIAYAALAGLALTVSLTLDTFGVRRLGTGAFVVVQYGVWSSVITATMLVAVSRGALRTLGIVRRDPATCLLGASLLISSYLLGLWAFAQGPIGLVALLREMNVVFAGLLAIFVLSERVSARQWSAIGVSVIGIVVIKAWG